MPEKDLKICRPEELLAVAISVIQANPDKEEDGLAAELAREIKELIALRTKKGSFSPDFAASSENIAHIVSRQAFGGEAADIARRQLSLVQEQRPVRVVKAILEVLGGHNATWPQILHDSLAKSLEAGGINIEKVDKTNVAYFAQIYNTTIQQTSFLIQKTIAAAMEDLRSTDGEDPKYPYR